MIRPHLAYSSSYTLNTVTTGLVTYCAAHSHTHLDLGAFTDPPFCNNIQWASYWVQLATAAVATALIAYKTW